MSRELTEEDYDIFLDEVYGEVKIAGLTYSTSYALKEIDPVAYDVGFADWSSEVETEAEEYKEDEPEEEEEENAPCVKCGRTDLPLHENYQCAECWPEK
jgi:hypothetical protein